MTANDAVESPQGHMPAPRKVSGKPRTRATARDESPATEKGSPVPQPDDAEAEVDTHAGIAREVGDLDDPDAVEDGGALPGRAGGGLVGG